ncbi:MAG: YkvA family protein [Thermomicrobiales bacterium]
MPILTAAYVISPIDLIPDFLLGVGQLDDLGVIGIAAMLLFRWLPRLAPRQVVAGHLAEMGFGRHDGSRGDRSNREESERVVEAVFRVNRRDSGDASRT